MKACGDIESVNLGTGDRRQRVVGNGESCLEPFDVPKGFYFRDDLDGGRLVKHEAPVMHYRNGREAKNGDKIVKLEGGKVVAYGVLHSATPGNDFCNGNIAVIQAHNDYACMVDCLHVDDVAEVLKEKALDKRPAAK